MKVSLVSGMPSSDIQTEDKINSLSGNESRQSELKAERSREIENRSSLTGKRRIEKET